MAEMESGSPVWSEKAMLEPSEADKDKVLEGNIDELTDQVEKALKKIRELE